MGLIKSWIIRGMILSVVASLASAGWILHDWVSPERVREALIATVQEELPGVTVEVESARLRLFGGISVQQLSLTRRGESQPFLTVPSAVIYHDKEQLSRGRITIRKLELTEPTLRVERLEDGGWNLVGLGKPDVGEEPIPTIVVEKATVVMSDRRANGCPPLSLVDAKLSLMNDPLTLLKIEAKGTVLPAPDGVPNPGIGFSVPVAVSLKLHRQTREIAAKVEVEDLAVGPDLAPAFDKLHPKLGKLVSCVTATIDIKADVLIPADPNRQPSYDVKLDVSNGLFEDAALPWPIENLTAILHIDNGKLTVEQGSAKFGPAHAAFQLETRTLTESAPASPPPGTPVVAHAHAHDEVQEAFQEFEKSLERIEVTLRSVPLNDELFAKLPTKSQRIRDQFGLNGTLDVTYRFTRQIHDWKREFDFRPNHIGMEYEKFRYPCRDVTGLVKHLVTSDGVDEIRVQLSGTASGRRIELRGRTAGAGPDPLIDLKLAGTDIPIDDRIFAALPSKYAEVMGKLRATARGDFVVDIHQEANVNRCENTFRIRVYDGVLNYKHFPIPLHDVKGHVLVRVTATEADRPLLPGLPLAPEVDTDIVEIRDFEATYGAGKIWVNGESESVPNTKDRRLSVRIQGDKCPLDEPFLKALREIKLGNLVRQFTPRGEITFGADVEILDRAATAASPLVSLPGTTPSPLTPANALLPGEPPFNPAEDLKVTLNFKGPSITPEFYPCSLDDLAGILRYQQGKLDLVRFSARHGASRYSLDAAEIRFGAGDEVWANLGSLAVRPLVLDPETLNAFPVGLRKAMTQLNPRGPMELFVKHLVVQTPATAAPPVPLPVAETLVRGQSPAPDPVSTPVPPAPSDPVVYWNLEWKLNGATLDAGVEWADVHGAIASQGRYEGTHLGPVLGNVWLNRATVAKQPISEAKISYRVRPQEPIVNAPGQYAPPVLELPDLTATMYQGTVGGEARITLADDVYYRVWLTASGVHLDEVAEHLKLGSGAELKGLAQGNVLIENRLDANTGELVFTGSGQVDVPSGRLYNLPLLLPLLKLLKLQTPDQTAFEEAHAIFDLRGDRVYVRQLDLLGTAVSLGGSGELTTGGEEVRFEFYTIWSQALRRWLTTPFGDVTSFLSGNLFKIEMVKENGEMKYYPHMLPAVTEPMRAVAERLRNRFDRSRDPAIKQ